MKNLCQYFKQLNHTWCYIWIFIFCGFLALDAFFPHFFGVTFLKILGIVLCPIYVAITYKEDRLLLLAFCFTLVADILLAFNNASLFGVFSFIMAQFTHFARLRNLKKNQFIIISIIITISFLLSVTLGFMALFLLGTLYAFFLVSNLIYSYNWKKHAKGKEKRSACFAFYGFLLFALCDICAASSFFCAIHAFPLLLKRLFDYLCWVFYYPSQIALSNSTKKLPREKQL